MIIQLTYFSRPRDFGPAILASMLEASRRNNRRDEVTGALLCHGALYLQWLEGPHLAVTATLGRILSDPRHERIELLCCHEASARLFPDWDLRHDPSGSWLWTEAAARAGALDTITPETSRALFERLAAQVEPAQA